MGLAAVSWASGVEASAGTLVGPATGLEAEAMAEEAMVTVVAMDAETVGGGAVMVEPLVEAHTMCGSPRHMA